MRPFRRFRTVHLIVAVVGDAVPCNVHLVRVRPLTRQHSGWRKRLAPAVSITTIIGGPIAAAAERRLDPIPVSPPRCCRSVIITRPTLPPAQCCFRRIIIFRTVHLIVTRAIDAKPSYSHLVRVRPETGRYSTWRRKPAPAAVIITKVAGPRLRPRVVGHRPHPIVVPILRRCRPVIISRLARRPRRAWAPFRLFRGVSTVDVVVVPAKDAAPCNLHRAKLPVTRRYFRRWRQLAPAPVITIVGGAIAADAGRCLHPIVVRLARRSRCVLITCPWLPDTQLCFRRSRVCRTIDSIVAGAGDAVPCNANLVRVRPLTGRHSWLRQLPPPEVRRTVTACGSNKRHRPHRIPVCLARYCRCVLITQQTPPAQGCFRPFRECGAIDIIYPGAGDAVPCNEHLVRVLPSTGRYSGWRIQRQRFR